MVLGMTDVKFPNGTVVTFDDNKYSTDQIRTLTKQWYTKFGGKADPAPAGEGMRFVNGKLMQGGSGASSESSGGSELPKPQAPQNNAPSSIPEGASAEQDRLNRSQADFPQEGMPGSPRTVKELGAYLKGRKDDAAAQAAAKAIPDWAFEKVFPRVLEAGTEAVSGVAYEAGRMVGGKELGRDAAGMLESEVGRVPELIKPEALPKVSTEVDKAAKDAAEKLRAVVKKQYEKPSGEPSSPSEGGKAPTGASSPSVGAIKPEVSEAMPAKRMGPMGNIPNASTPYPVAPAATSGGRMGRVSRAYFTGYGQAHAAVQGVLNNIKKVVAPATLSKATPYYGSYNLMAEAIRAFIGKSNRNQTIVEGAIEPFLRKFNNLSPIDQRVWMAYVEGRSTRFKGQTLKDRDLQMTADIVRATMNKYKNDLLSLPKYAKMHFIEDYLTHIWQDPNQARQVFGVGKFGTGRWAKLRDIPTIEDGLKAGLKLKHDNPLNAVMEYTYGMGRHIAKERTLQYARDNKWLKFSSGNIPGHTIVTNVFDALGRPGQLPDDMARVFNNFLSRGAAGIGPEFSSIYNAVQKATNFSTRAVLAFSGYHALNVAASAVADAAGRAITQIVGGKPLEGLKTLSMAKQLAAPIYYPFAGRKLAQQYANLADYGPRMRKIADQASRANARVKDLNNMIDFKSTAQGSFVKAWKQGTLPKELSADLKRIKDTYGAAALGVIGKNLGRIADTTSAWLFEHYIPALKNGALYYNMTDFIDRHPGATQYELDQATRAFVDSIDNRFGMMQRDNMFWNKLTSQIGQAALLSDTWQVGFLREFGGAKADLGKFISQRDPNFLSTRVSYVMGYALSMGMIGGVTTFMLTGTPPSSLKDLFYPRTGGKNPDGSEERILLPGHLKEIAEWERVLADIPHHAGREAAKVISGKINPFWPLAEQVISAKDYRGKDIAPTGSTGELIRAEISLIMSHLTPIVASSLQQSHGDKSKLNPVTDVLGIRSAPSYTSGEKSEFLEKSRAFAELKRKMLGELIQLRQNPSDTNLAQQIKKDKQDLEILSRQRSAAQSSYKGTLSQ